MWMVCTEHFQFGYVDIYIAQTTRQINEKLLKWDIEQINNQNQQQKLSCASSYDGRCVFKVLNRKLISQVTVHLNHIKI